MEWHKYPEEKPTNEQAVYVIACYNEEHPNYRVAKWYEDLSDCDDFVISCNHHGESGFTCETDGIRDVIPSYVLAWIEVKKYERGTEQ